jgi:hypothetical protein
VSAGAQMRAEISSSWPSILSKRGVLWVGIDVSNTVCGNPATGLNHLRMRHDPEAPSDYRAGLLEARISRPQSDGYCSGLGLSFVLVR